MNKAPSDPKLRVTGLLVLLLLACVIAYVRHGGASPFVTEAKTGIALGPSLDIFDVSILSADAGSGIGFESINDNADAYTSDYLSGYLVARTVYLGCRAPVPSSTPIPNIGITNAGQLRFGITASPNDTFCNGEIFIVATVTNDPSRNTRELRLRSSQVNIGGPQGSSFAACANYRCINGATVVNPTCPPVPPTVRPPVECPSGFSTYYPVGVAFISQPQPMGDVGPEGIKTFMLDAADTAELQQLIDAVGASNLRIGINYKPIGNNGQRAIFAYAGTPAPFTISPTSQSFPHGFPSTTGTGMVAVTAANSSCFWTAIKNETIDTSFVDITSGGNGTGTGMMNYSVQPNSGFAARANTILIGGQTFTVNQAGRCPPAGAIAIGQTISGQLSATDCQSSIVCGADIRSSFSDFYTFSGTAGRQIAISLDSTQFDPYLNLYDPLGAQIGCDDDGGGGSNSRIPAGSGFLTLPRTGTYTIRAGSFSAAGAGSYTLTLGANCLAVTANPTDRTVCAGNNTSFTAAASGGATVQWQVASPTSCATFSNIPGATGTTLMLTNVTAAQHGNRYRAVFTSACSGAASTVVSAVAALTVDTITVNPVNPTLPAGRAGEQYSQTFTATGGTAPYSFTVSAGPLPPGLSLSSGGVLSGAPTGFGTFTFTIKATGANGCMGTRAYSLLINPPCPNITVNPSPPGGVLPNGSVGMLYSQTFTATGGAGPYGFTLGSGALPPGLSLSPAGVLSGTPTSGGSFGFTVKATDANGCMGTRGYSLTINSTGLQYFPLPRPIRLFDTRAPIPGFPACEYLNQPLAANAELVRQARVNCDGITIPANAQAIVGNATVVAPSGGGFITLWPNGQPRPPVSNLNYTTGQVVPNAFTVGLGADGTFRIYSVASTHFIVDVTGYFAPPGASGLYYHPLPRPIRLFDTRAPIPGFAACEYLNQPLVANAELARQARITCDSLTIPADAQAIVGNATVVGPSGAGFATLWPNGQLRPPVSNLNYSAGQVVPNAFTVGLGNDGQFRVYSLASTHFIVDVTGYYSPSPTDANGAGLLYSPLAKPIRLFDTRAPIPGFPACEYLNQPLAANAELAKQARITCDNITIPASALAIVGNATVVAPLGGGFITLWPNGQARPPVSNLNYVAGQVVPNAFTVGLGADGQFRTYSLAQTHFIVDLTGYFAP